jgi:hypothetical protein
MTFLVAKHEKFAQFLADGLPQGEAYVKAGFKAKTPGNARASASQLLKKNCNILQRVADILDSRVKADRQATAKAVEATGTGKEWVLEQLRENVVIAKAAVPVLNSKGEPTGEYQTNLNAANRALELIGKEQGMFNDRARDSTPPSPLDELSAEELLAFRDTVAKALDAAGPKKSGRAKGRSLDS